MTFRNCFWGCWDFNDIGPNCIGIRWQRIRYWNPNLHLIRIPDICRFFSRSTFLVLKFYTQKHWRKKTCPKNNIRYAQPRSLRWYTAREKPSRGSAQKTHRWSEVARRWYRSSPYYNFCQFQRVGTVTAEWFCATASSVMQPLNWVTPPLRIWLRSTWESTRRGWVGKIWLCWKLAVNKIRIIKVWWNAFNWTTGTGCLLWLVPP